MRWSTKRWRGAFAAVEFVAVVVVIALLLTMGFMLYSSMRLAARVAEAERGLRQASIGMEPCFRHRSSYPPPGSDLAVELAPFARVS